MAGGKNEPIPVYPVGIVRIHGKSMPEEHGSYLGCPEGKPQMTRTACMDGIDGKASSLRGGLLENFFVKVAHGKSG